MNYKIMAMGLLMVAAAMQSCKDEGPDGGAPAVQGTEINFGVGLDPNGDVKTRTYYGEPVDNKWPIYWNYEPKDHIFVYSPQALQERNQASYTVNTTARNQNKEVPIVHDNAFGVQVGNETGTYDFYGLYPASAQRGVATGTDNSATISGTISANQEGVFTGTTQPKQSATATADVPEANCPVISTTPTDAQLNASYFFKPDMTQCLMTAATKNVTIDEKTVVNLQFQPFATCIDVTLKGPGLNTVSNPPRVVSVELSSTTGKLAGDFTYTVDEDGNYTIKPADDAVSSVSFNTQAKDAQGDPAGIPLVGNSTLNLQIFIMPDPAIKDLKVTVNTSNFQRISKTLTINNNAAIEPGQIHPVVLPAYDADEAEFNYTNWLSQLDPRIYVSEVSLPGSALTFTYAGDNLETFQRTQSLNLGEQFNKGVRVFQTHVWIATQKSDIDGQATSICISVNGRPINRPTEKGSGFYSLGDVMEVLNNEMSGAHSDEFCVLLLSDWCWDTNRANNPFKNGNSTTAGYHNSDETTAGEFYTRIKTALNSPEMSKYVVTKFDENTTIGELRGKVLVKFAPSYQSTVVAGSDVPNYDNLPSYVKDADGAKCLFNPWINDANDNVGYAQMKFGTATGLQYGYSYFMPNVQNPILYIHSEKGNPWHQTFTDGPDKQIVAYNQYYDSNAHNIFGLTYLGGAGKKDTETEKDCTPDKVADHYYEVWTKAIAGSTYKANKPYGWVMFNCVGNNTNTTAGIQKVIEQNNREGFKLNRNRNSSTPQGKPSGDVTGPASGGKLWQ